MILKLLLKKLLGLRILLNKSADYVRTELKFTPLYRMTIIQVIFFIRYVRVECPIFPDLDSPIFAPTSILAKGQL